MDSLFTVGFATVFAVVNAWIIKQESYVTLRGRRVAFFIALIVGLAIAQVLIHWNVDCDLRPNATTPCQIGWVK